MLCNILIKMIPWTADVIISGLKTALRFPPDFTTTLEALLAKYFSLC